MIEKLVDLLVQFGTWVSPVAVIKVYERGVVLRWGLCHRVLEPGWHWKWPLAEDVVEINTVVTTLRLPPQTLTTLDKQSVVVSAIIKYRITNPEVYVSEIWDAVDVLADTTMGAIRQTVGSLSYDDLLNLDSEAKVVQLVRNEVNSYGFKVAKITFVDLSKVRSFRLIQHNQDNISN